MKHTKKQPKAHKRVARSKSIPKKTTAKKAVPKRIRPAKANAGTNAKKLKMKIDPNMAFTHLEISSSQPI